MRIIYESYAHNMQIVCDSYVNNMQHICIDINYMCTYIQIVCTSYTICICKSGAPYVYVCKSYANVWYLHIICIYIEFLDTLHMQIIYKSMRLAYDLYIVYTAHIQIMCRSYTICI